MRGQDIDVSVVEMLDSDIEGRAGNSLVVDLFDEKRFEFVVSEPPWGLRWSDIRPRIESERLREPAGRYAAGLPGQNDAAMLFVQHIVSKLSQSDGQPGRAAILLPAAPMYRSGSESAIREWLLEQGLLEGIVKLPTALFTHSAIPMYVWLLEIGRTEKPTRFVDASHLATRQLRSRDGRMNTLSDSAIETIVEHYRSTEPLDSHSIGMTAAQLTSTDENQAKRSRPGADFSTGFTRMRSLAAEQQVARLDSVYSSYDQVPLGSLCNISRVSSDAVGKRTARYLHPRTMKLDGNHSAAKNGFALVFRDDVNAEYVAAYLNSDLGQLYLEALTIDGVVPNVRVADLERMTIPYPDPSLQEVIVSNIELVAKIAQSVESVRRQVVLNPHDRGALEELLDLTSTLTEEERIRALIRRGESRTLEFKSSLFENLHTHEKDRKITEAALKNIAAFLNSEGGTLLIGVEDSGAICGIESEMELFYRGNADKYQLALKDAVKANVDASFFDKMRWKLLGIDGHTVLLIDVEASLRPCYFGTSEDFYIRISPAAEKLIGSNAVDYIRTHFQ